MAQSLQLGTSPQTGNLPGMRRINRLPVFIAIAVLVLFLGVVILGLSWRGTGFNRGNDIGSASNSPATSFGDQLKRGISDGIIGDPDQREVFQPSPIAEPPRARLTDVTPQSATSDTVPQRAGLEPDVEWRARLKREQEEQFERERNRQRMARLQAAATALDSPLEIDVSNASDQSEAADAAVFGSARATPGGNTSDVYAAAMKAGLAGQTTDQNGQSSKEDFFNQDIKELGYLTNSVVSPMSRYELKRGSVIPATLITGLNSDLPGRISAQISQNIYDSASGHQLLVPQSARLFGRYDSKVSFGQERVLVVWTDLIFPNGSTLQLGGMAGTDAQGSSGFEDKVDRHLWRTFGSAALVAVIGTGIDMSMPQSSTLATQDTASDAARRNFAEVFGRAAEQTISKNLNVQPTIRIRPGYKFNVLVDQDIIFPGRYHAE